eukprot:TRINITY_DN8067_c0_g1_i3.p1 TRINITY_DN8067_c0_g1~~TRINITY_DN8067_c0_g1_i3.p1  ORF type:complete len:206 (-),score=67.10 TRINITY_DN8067_c0_g1_i3:272-889(-)
MVSGSVSRKEREILKAASKAAEEAARLEAASWVDNDKKLVAKQARAQEREAKCDAKHASRCEARAMQAAEEECEKSSSKNGRDVKVTQAEVARRLALASSAKPPAKKATRSQVVPQPKLEPNRNREMDVADASGVEAALAALQRCGSKGGDATAKAAAKGYGDFEERMLVELRQEKPGLKLSQLKEHVAKAWARSPENPKNGAAT